MPEAVIVGGVRTPFAKATGALDAVDAPELGRIVVRELLERFDMPAEEVDELIAGNVASPVDSANVARVISLRAGIPQDRIAHTVSRNCASGFECLTQAVDRIRLGRASCVVAVGVDSMSNIPVIWQKSLTHKFLKLSRAKSAMQKFSAIARIRPRDLAPRIGIQLGLTDPVTGMMMGSTADKLAREYDISRQDQDEYALRSHCRALEALHTGRLEEETMSVYPDPKNIPFTRDDGPRERQTYDGLAKLKPYFDRRWGTVTIGNSCQVTDGAVALLVMDAEKAKSLGIEPLGRIRDYAYAGCDPTRMGLGPVYATDRVMKSTGMTLDEMDLIELNEAFASQAIACLKGFASPPEDCLDGKSAERLGPVDEEKVNVNGGAIALGHPVGATGARLVLTLLHELKRREQNVGLATLCIGGGQGGAVVVERMAA